MKDSWRLGYLLLLLPFPAFAEVSDKVASVPQLWTTAVVAGVLAFLASRYKVALGLVLLPASALLVLAGVEPVLDPSVGPAIASEQGRTYFVAVYGSSAILLALHLTGLWLGWQRKHRAAA